jgi:saccharopine dehydrogenase (NAD+, L-lysine forming)
VAPRLILRGMRILVIGVGGVGAAVAAVAKRRSFFDRIVFADRDVDRAQRAVTTAEDSRFAAAGADASDPASVARLAREVGADAVLNAVDPRFTLPVFHGAFDAGAVYLDMAMSLSHPHPARPLRAARRETR